MAFKVGQKIGPYMIGYLTDVPVETDWGKAHPGLVIVIEVPDGGPLIVRLSRGETDPQVLLRAIKAELEKRKGIVGKTMEV